MYKSLYATKFANSKNQINIIKNNFIGKKMKDLNKKTNSNIAVVSAKSSFWKLASFAIAIIIIAFVGVMTPVEAKAQIVNKYPVSKADYVNISSTEIPKQDYLLLPELIGDLFFDKVRMKRQQTYCNHWMPTDIESDFPNCDPSDPANWYGWEFAVYEFRDKTYGCKVRVEYEYRNCKCDHNITQHNILAVIYETTNWPILCSLGLAPEACKCNKFRDWLNSGTTFEQQQKMLAFYDDMYYKLSQQTFINHEDSVYKLTGKRIYCDDPMNHPIKTHHRNGACESICIQTYHYGDKERTVIARSPCTDETCCFYQIKTCRNRKTGIIETTTSTMTSSTQQAQSACNSMGYLPGFICSGGETNTLFPCEFVCDDLVRYRYCFDDLSYPFRDLYENAVSAPLKKETMIDYEKVFKIHPNPANNVLNIEFVSNIKDVTSMKIVDNNGAALLTTDNGTLNISNQIDISKLSNGTYFIIVTVGEIEYSTNFVITK